MHERLTGDELHRLAVGSDFPNRLIVSVGDVRSSILTDDDARRKRLLRKRLAFDNDEIPLSEVS